ncbi:MAG: glycosyltransferase [Synechococcales bacterium]|nr:glycosyltransferase [Synechococcales bacterium]
MPSVPPRISAIICTHNRDRYLGKAIDSLLCQTPLTGETWVGGETASPESPFYEVLVVDNGSTDRTREVVEARLGNPRLRYVHEPTLGLSVARNRAVQETQADILAYLDDDAIASPHWLSHLVQAYETHPKLAIAGGKVTLLWEDQQVPPPWLSSSLAGNLGAYDLGNEFKLIQQPGLTPRGLNYSIRRLFLAQVGGFDPQLGRVGKNLLSNEELQMTALALQAGWQVAYLPQAIVAHHVAPERMQRRWFLERGWWQGISECYREQIAGEAGWGQFPRGAERLLRGLYKALRFHQQPEQVFENLVYSYGQVGYLSKVCQGILLSSDRHISS